jgi:hypothetical protein
MFLKTVCKNKYKKFFRFQIHGNIAFNRYERMITLPDRNIDNGQMGKITGWGTVTHPMITHASTLQKTSMKVIKPTECKLQFPIDIYDDQFCAFNAFGIGPCVVSFLILF